MLPYMPMGGVNTAQHLAADSGASAVRRIHKIGRNSRAG
jgi:hypothetical protein